MIHAESIVVMRKDKIGLAVFMSLLIMPVGLCAQQRSMTEILAIAQQHYSEKGSAIGTRAATTVEMIPSSCFIQLRDDHESFYLCNMPDAGFVLVSADQEMPEILGYSKTSIDPAKGLPPGLLHVMNSYVGMSVNDPITKAPFSAQTQVGPLLTTTWDQGTPYNNMCPRDGATRSMTGCVATSAAQLMKYYKWPTVTPSGKIEYTTNSKKINVSIDLSDYKFSWDLMLDAYKEGAYSNAQASAVAKLMYAIGAACQMDYSNAESGSSLLYCVQGLNQYFLYDNDMYLLLGDFVQAEQWNQLIIDELEQSQPVLMSGNTADAASGHSFVLDGYKTEGGNLYYHVNWGWSGLADGYYMLNKMTPTEGGAGMGSGSYNDQQLIVLNCKPDDGVTTPVYGQIGSLELSKNHFDSGETLLFDLSIKQLGCLFTKEFSGTVSFEIVDASGSSMQNFDFGSIDIPYGETAVGDVNGFSCSSLPDGVYSARLYLKNQKGKRIDLLTSAGWPEILVGDVESGISSLDSDLKPERSYEISGVEKKNASNQTLPAGFYIINGRKVIVK